MERIPRVEQPITPEKNRKELYFDALKAKRDVLSSHHTLNQLRKGKKIEQMSDTDVEDYKSVKIEFDKRRELFLASFANLNEEDGQKVAELTSLTRVEIALSSLEKPAESAGAEAEVPATGGVRPEDFDNDSPTRQATEDTTGEIISPVDAESPDRGTTMDEVDRMLRYSKDTVRPLEIAYWESKKLELLEKQEAEANPDRPAPVGFMQRIRDSYNKAKEKIMGANRISGGQDTVESRMSPLGLRGEAMEPVSPSEPTEPTQSESAQPVRPEVQPQPESGVTSQQVEKEPKKASGWGWLKERGKGVWNFGLWEFHQAERFRSKTKEVSNDTDALATLIQQERNLNLEEAQTEANEITNELKKNNLSVSSSEFFQINKDITERKSKENDQEVEYIVKSAGDDLVEKLAKYRGEAGQDVLTRENQLAFEADLRGELNKMRDGALRKDFINFAKLMRRNLDENWHWRYVWGAAEAVLGFVGVKFLVVKWEAIQAAKLLAAEKAATGGVEAGIAAAQESLVGHLQNSIWQDLANSGVPTEQLPDLTKQVLNSNNLSDRILQGIKGGLDAWRLPSNFVIDYSSVSQKLAELGVDLAKLGIR